MVRHGRSSACSYLADPTSPIPSHCASIVVTSTLRVNCVKSYCVVNPHSNSQCFVSYNNKFILISPISVVIVNRHSTKKASNHHANLPLEMYSFTL